MSSSFVFASLQSSQTPLGLFAQQGVDPNLAAGGAIALVCQLIVFAGIYVLTSLSFVKLFEKAGRPGWPGWVPIYNAVVLMEVLHKPAWWVVMLCIPCVNIIFSIMVCIELAKAYNKEGAFAIGLILLGIVFLPILAFGDSRYVLEGPGGPRRERDYDDYQR